MSPTEPSTAPRAAWSIAVVATLGMSVSYVDRQTLAALAPSVTRSLSIDQTHYGWLLSGFSMAYLVGAPIAGTVVDRFGARRGFAAAVVVWSVVAGAHAFAASFASLFVLRLLLGAAESPSFPSATQAIRRALPGARRPLAFGLLLTGSSLGAVVASTFSIRMETAYGFRVAFMGTALLGTLWIPVWLWTTRGARLEQTPPADRATEVRWCTLVTSGPVLRAIIVNAGSAPVLLFVLNWTSKYLVDRWSLPRGDLGRYLVAASRASEASTSPRRASDCNARTTIDGPSM